MSYHARIMNIQAPEQLSRAAVYGHVVARHAAAEIANDADAEIDSLRAENERLRGLIKEMDRAMKAHDNSYSVPSSQWACDWTDRARAALEGK